jgi:hypothetical protein
MGPQVDRGNDALRPHRGATPRRTARMREGGLEPPRCYPLAPQSPRTAAISAFYTLTRTNFRRFPQRVQAVAQLPVPIFGLRRLCKELPCRRLDSRPPRSSAELIRVCSATGVRCRGEAASSRTAVNATLARAGATLTRSSRSIGGGAKETNRTFRFVRSAGCCLKSERLRAW